MPVPPPATLDVLRDPARYALVDELAHADVLPYVRRHLRARSWITGVYWAATALGLAGVVLLARRSGLPAFDAFSAACLGAALGMAVLLPVHESVHALTYRALGARAVAVRYDWRRLTASCTADRHVLSGRAFAGVCLAPLAALTPPLAAAAAAAPGRPGLLFGGAALLHLGACSGDVALVHALVHARRRWRGARLYTYDDVAAGRSYVYRALDAPA